MMRQRQHTTTPTTTSSPTRDALRHRILLSDDDDDGQVTEGDDYDCIRRSKPLSSSSSSLSSFFYRLSADPSFWIRLFGIAVLLYTVKLIVSGVSQNRPHPSLFWSLSKEDINKSTVLSFAEEQEDPALFLSDNPNDDSKKALVEDTNDLSESSPSMISLLLQNMQKQCSNWTPPPPSATESLAIHQRPKTLWVPSYPDSLDEVYLKHWLSSGNLLSTGFKAPVKAYYLSSKTLKRCKTDATATVLCTVVHPAVLMKPPPDADKFKSYFDKTVLYIIRNPMSVLPAHHNGKAIKYHNQVGQVSIDQWRTFRNSFLPGLLQGYKHQIKTWAIDMPYYSSNIQYLAYEHIMDPQRGPATLEKLKHILRMAGYPTASSSSSPTTATTSTQCVWYHSMVTLKQKQRGVHKSVLSDPIARQFDFSLDYIPGYTAAQRDLMIAELQSLIQELLSSSSSSSNADDNDAATKHASLIAILKEYITDIRHNIVLDEEGEGGSRVSGKQ